MVQFLCYSPAFVNVSENESSEFCLTYIASYRLNLAMLTLNRLWGLKQLLISFIHFEIQD